MCARGSLHGARRKRRLARQSFQASSHGNGFQFGIEATVEEHEKSEARGFDDRAVAEPSVRALAWRIVQPVTGVGKGLVQGFQVGITGIIVTVEAEVGGGLRRRFRTNAKEKQAR